MIIAINLMIIGHWLFTSGAIDDPTLRAIGCVTYLASTAVATILWEEHKKGNKK